MSKVDAIEDSDWAQKMVEKWCDTISKEIESQVDSAYQAIKEIK